MSVHRASGQHEWDTGALAGQLGSATMVRQATEYELWSENLSCTLPRIDNSAGNLCIQIFVDKVWDTPFRLEDHVLYEGCQWRQVFGGQAVVWRKI